MLRLSFFLALAAILGESANVAGPSRFYIVSVFYSHDVNYVRIVDVTPDGPDSIVRCVRVAPRSPQCLREIVQAAETRILNTTPAELLQSTNPCTVKVRGLNSAIKKFAQPGLVEEATSFGIVAQCGSESVALALPPIERVDSKQMQNVFPDLVRLWDIASEVTHRAFGSSEIFHDRTEKDDLALQHQGEKLIPVLFSGSFDTGLGLAVKGNITAQGARRFRFMLEDYGSPVSLSQAKETPRLLNAEEYDFIHFVAPDYPRLAKMARIQGRVELQLRVDVVTGEVSSATIVAGHPLLHDSAIAAAKQWRFDPNSITSDTVRATLEFEIHCPTPAMYQRSP